MARQLDKKRLLKALRGLPFCTQFHVRAAATLLAVNGLDNALAYVEAVRANQQPQLLLCERNEEGRNS